MNIFLYIKQAFSAIKANKLRSFLSTLWIIIWILSFVIMIAIWEWTKKSIMEWFSKDSNLVYIEKDFEKKELEIWEKEIKSIFTEEIINEAKEKIPNLWYIYWEYEEVNTSWATYKSENINSYWIKPISQDYFKIKEVKQIIWSLFSEKDFKEWKNLAIIWYWLVKETFKDENPIWKKIIIWWEIFIVSAILEEKWWEYDKFIFVPSSSIKKLFWKVNIRKITAFTQNEKDLDKLKENLKYFLEKKSWTDNFSELWIRVDTNKDMIKQIESFSNSFTYFLIFIWWISLIVWWIWIMNIMLVSVTERTREIWIRKAIWATNFTIMIQFLIESIILTLIGSASAIWLSYLVANLVEKYAPKDLWISNVSIEPNILIIAITVSISMWIIFWIMPAYKAARLKPIDALHFE